MQPRYSDRLYSVVKRPSVPVVVALTPVDENSTVFERYNDFFFFYLRHRSDFVSPSECLIADRVSHEFGNSGSPRRAGGTAARDLWLINTVDRSAPSGVRDALPVPDVFFRSFSPFPFDRPRPFFRVARVLKRTNGTPGRSA